MAMRSGAPVVPAFMARQKSGRYKFILKPAMEAVCTDDYEADLQVNTQRFTKNRLKKLFANIRISGFGSTSAGKLSHIKNR